MSMTRVDYEGHLRTAFWALRQAITGLEAIDNEADAQIVQMHPAYSLSRLDTACDLLVNEVPDLYDEVKAQLEQELNAR